MKDAELDRDVAKNWKDYLKETPRGSIISNVMRCTISGRPAGGEVFVRNLEERIGRNLRLKPRGRPWPK